MPLTGIGAAERPHTEVRAGLNRDRYGDAREGLPAVLGVGHKNFDTLGHAIRGGALAGTKTR